MDKINVTNPPLEVYYLYSDETQELIGINKTLCSALEMQIINNEIADIRFYVSPSGDVFPDEEIDANERTLKGFIWREKERPISKLDLFSEADQQLQLPKIEGIAIPEAFFENSIIKN
jgi:hypothetical protein